MYTLWLPPWGARQRESPIMRFGWIDAAGEFLLITCVGLMPIGCAGSTTSSTRLTNGDLNEVVQQMRSSLARSDFINQRAAVFAKRLRREAEGDVTAQIELALRLTRARPATPDDIRRGAELIDWRQGEGGKDAQEALTYFCLMVLNLNEFIYLD